MNRQNNASVAVVGLWHLGCTVSASLADKGYKVTGLDFDRRLIQNLRQAQLPVYEPGLEELTVEQIKSGSLNFSTDFKRLASAQYIVIAYDTPVDDKDQSDLGVIFRAAREIKKYAANNATVVVMSQLPVGTCRKILQDLRRGKPKISVVYNPENIRLGNALKTFSQAERVIIGVDSEEARKKMESFYHFFPNPLLFMSLESAEIVKHSINSFLANSISFINQIADLSEAAGANILDVVRGMKSDSRIGQQAFLSPGLGFAGGTLGRDLRTLENVAKAKKVDLKLISQIYQTNLRRKEVLYKKISKVYPKIKGKTFALFGLVYKPGTDTLRRSLAVEIAKKLLKDGAVVKGFDPALKPSSAVPRGLKLAADPYAAAQGADALIIVTEWPEFAKIDYDKIKLAMASPVLFDTKNILAGARLWEKGFSYFGTGVAISAPAFEDLQKQPLDFSQYSAADFKKWFSGKVMVITGGTGGIGRAIAQKFLRANAKVVLLARNLPNLLDTQKKLAAFGNCEIESAEVQDPRQAKNAVEKIFKRHKRIDFLVNCAGTQGPIGEFHTNPLDHWERAVAVNLGGTAHMAHAVLPIMAKQKHGKIINLSGGGAVQPFPNFSAYATSKAAVVRFTENLAKEYEAHNIQINAISPGAINTAFLEEVLKAGDRAGKEYYIKAQEQKRRGGDSPEHAAELVMFLCSPKSHNLTGKVIAALWDPWKKLDEPAVQKLNGNSEYTLRRIDNKYFKEINS